MNYVCFGSSYLLLLLLLLLLMLCSNGIRARGNSFAFFFPSVEEMWCAIGYEDVRSQLPMLSSSSFVFFSPLVEQMCM
jgi:hypothetical protein